MATANKVAMEQRKDLLKEQLNRRPDALKLIDEGILKPFAAFMAPSLQPNALLLEQQLAIRVSEDYLQQIGVLDLEAITLYGDSWGWVGPFAPALVSKLRELKFVKRKDLLKRQLNARLDREWLIDNRILQMDASELEQVSNQVSKQYLREIGVLSQEKDEEKEKENENESESDPLLGKKKERVPRNHKKSIEYVGLAPKEYFMQREWVCGFVCCEHALGCGSF